MEQIWSVPGLRQSVLIANSRPEPVWLVFLSPKLKREIGMVEGPSMFGFFFYSSEVRGPAPWGSLREGFGAVLLVTTVL